MKYTALIVTTFFSLFVCFYWSNMNSVPIPYIRQSVNAATPVQAPEKYIMQHVAIDSHIENYSLHQINSTAISKLNVKKREMYERYLFPLIYYGCGPCEQYSFFVSGIVNAISQNRSIVTIPFHNNHLQNANVERSLNETFNYSKLRQIVGLVTVDEFIDVCGTTFTPQQVLLGPQGTPEKAELREQRLHYYEVYVRKMKNYIPNIKLPTRQDVEIYQERVSQHSLRMSYDVDCLFFVTAVQFYNEYRGPEYNSIMTQISKHLVRAPYLQRLADNAIQQISGGSHYAALHWRNRSAEYCSNALPPDEYKHKCKGILREEVGKLAAVSVEIADAIASRLEKMNITRLYMATPEYEHVLINDLKKRFPGTKSASDIILDEKYKKDNYVYSLVDQLICQRSDYFIRSRFSVWAKFVLFFREKDNKTSVDMWDLPGYPESVKHLNIMQ